jgi:UDP-N-acetylglucosamine--N-acetylmuramyl-(pentapeptide) pyrophosphoryl-undecaprenol N-acetylglucosamine transferase
VVDYIDRMPDALAASDLAVGRGGAMSTAEFLAWGIPAIVIPLPSAAADHQSKNARALEAAGAALHLPEAGLTPEGLWDAVMSIASDSKKRDAMAAKARERGRPDSANDIARSIAEILFGQVSEGNLE